MKKDSFLGIADTTSWSIQAQEHFCFSGVYDSTQFKCMRIQQVECSWLATTNVFEIFGFFTDPLTD